ncbi:uncharacterized protein LOC103147880 isoform X1 [Poecilia formosa]|nr:PREDICTED: uncharacterized protein LOC103147880 isoform X1 [Poecilia formosa]XP_016534337.1 PREDICTED: uncharacterized protein LOC103147880 isoform X1 [Poecilia formosa]
MEITRRTSYDAAFKLKAIDLAVLEGNRAAALKLGVNESMIRRWRQQQVELTKCQKTRKAFRGQESRWPELEDVLEDWVNTQRAGGRGVSTLQIRLNAKSIARQMNIDNFNGGPSWCLRFMRRKNLSIRAETPLFQQLPLDYQEKVTNFRQFVEAKIVENAIGPDNIINMGEVPLTFDMSLTKTCASSISEKTNGHERTNFTCVLGCTASGQKLPPMVIFKRKTMPKDQLSKDIVVKVNQRGRLSEYLMKEWLTECYGKRSGGFFRRKKALLVLNSMRAHITDSVKAAIKRTSSIPAVIPRGTEKYLQPLDISVNRAFKAAFRGERKAWMSSGDKSFTETGRMRRASFSEVCQWILAAWSRMNESTIISGFRKAGLLREEGTTASEPALPRDDCNTESNTDIETEKYYVEMEQLSKQERDFSSHQKKAEPLQIKEEQDGAERQRMRGDQEEQNPPDLKEEQQEFEASQIKEEDEELCVSQDEDHLLLKWKTYTFEVSPVNEEKYHFEPDGNQLDLQDAAEAENQVQEENDSQLKQDDDLEPNGKYWKSLFSGEMHDGFFPQDGRKRRRIHTARLQSVYFVDDPRVEEESTTAAVGEAKFAEVESLESHPWPHLKDYFFFEARDKSNEKTLHFQCVLCQPKKITIKGQAKSLYNLKSHINRKHPAHATQFEEDIKAGSSRGKHRLSVSSSASSQSSQPCAKRARQPSFGETSSKTAGTDVSQSMVDKQIVDLFVHNLLPLHVVESPTFVGLIKMLNPSMTSMSRHILSRSILASHDQLEEHLIRLLEDIPWVATTADCWSAHNKSYLGMTAHWLDPKTRARRHALLACTRVRGHHSSDVLAQAMLDTHSKFNLQDKVTRTTTDNGKNFVKAFVQFGAEAEFLPNIPEAAAESEEDWIQDVDPEAGGVEYISVDATLDKSSSLGLKLPVHMKCAAHTFNLVASVDASEALNCTLFRSAYRKAMSKARALWCLQSRSTVAAACIFEAFKRRLAVPDGTRWNSTYNSVVVLNGLLEKSRDAVNRVMTQLKLQTFTSSDVGFLSEYVQVMCNVAKALDKIQGEDQAYLGSLLPTVAATVMRLKEVKLKRLLHCGPLVDAILAGISKRFGPLLEDLECQLAAAFHPKFRLFWLEQFNNSQVGRVTKAMEAVVQTALSALSEEGSNTSSNEEEEGEEEDDFFSNITRSCDDRSHRSLKWKAQNLVKTWLEAGSKDAMTDRAFLGEQVLIDLFTKYNTPVPSSAAVWHLFCQSHDILRAGVSDVGFESLMFMKGNQHHMDDMTKAQLE